MAEIKANLVDIPAREIYPVVLTFNNGVIADISKIPEATNYLLPGFIDAHVHIESSMLIPSEFARLAAVHGTVATVSDPHEIGNVLGIRGVEFMMQNGNKVLFKFNFGAPSCVPATPFETAGAEITATDIDQLLAKNEIKYLSEMMNWPGVINRDKAVMEKIDIARKHNKPVDGHAPGLKGNQAEKYISAGITTDHECFTYEEALGKIELGMKISIREGSAARNFDALIKLVDEYPDMVMFCSDDKHPDEHVEGHINILAERAVKAGMDIFNVLQAACLNPVKHYNLEVGMLRPGDAADFIIVEDLETFKVRNTYVDGTMVAENGRSLITSIEEQPINNFNISSINKGSLGVPVGGDKLRVIEAFDGQLITLAIKTDFKSEEGKVVCDLENDILKLVVVNRYFNTTPSIAFIKNFVEIKWSFSAYFVSLLSVFSNLKLKLISSI